MTVAGARGSEGALAAVLPAGTRALWTDDAQLASALAGAYAVDAAQPDVVVVNDPRSLATAPRAETVVVLLDGAPRALARGGRAADAAARLGAHARARVRAREAQQALQRQGHRQVQVRTWDHGVPLADVAVPAGRRALHRPGSYPRRAVVVATAPGTPTLLDAVLAQLGATPAPGALPGPTPGGSVLLPTDRGLLRLAVGAGRRQVDDPAAVLELLGQARLSAPAAARVPQLLERGRTGGASWSLEQTMPGTAAPSALSAALRDDCVDFLVALFPAPQPPASGRAALHVGADLAGELTGRSDDVRRVVEPAQEQLQGLPRGFAHRDFWHRNLLVQDGRLSAVVDWDSAGGGALPFLDLLQLVTTSALRPGGHAWGRALVQTLLPWAERGGDATAARYAQGVGVDVSPVLLRALVAVHWLDWLGYQLTRYAERRQDPRWVRGNVVAVLDALLDGAQLSARPR